MLGMAFVALAVTSVNLSTTLGSHTLEGALYGDLRLSAVHSDSSGSEHDEDLTDNGSYFGFEASIREGSITAFGKYERHLDTDDSINNTTGFGSATTGSATGGTDYVREAYAGVETPYGTLIYGQAETAYSAVARKVDPFFATGLSDIAGTASLAAFGIGPSYGNSSLSIPLAKLAFITNTIAYTSPSFAGATINTAIFLDEDRGSAQDHDFGLGVDFDRSGLNAGLQVLNVNSDSAPGGTVGNFGDFLAGVDFDAMRAYAGYTFQRAGVAFGAERIDVRNTATPHLDSLFVAGYFSLTKDIRLAAALGKTENIAEGTGATVGVFYDVIRNLTAYTGVRRYAGSAGNPDAFAAALGATYRFNLRLGQ
jgi:hypothetical protein